MSFYVTTCVHKARCVLWMGTTREKYYDQLDHRGTPDLRSPINQTCL